MDGLQLLTNSRRNCFNKCARMYSYIYEQGYRPVKTSDALRFGSLFHGALEMYWLLSLKAGLNWLHDQKESDYNVYEKELAKQLLIGYSAKWHDQDDSEEDCIPELEFRAPLINPDTMAESRTFSLAGKIDVTRPGKKQIVEHKTTSEDLSPESDYWAHLAIDGQVSGYYVGARALGYECEECLYDVIRKPMQRPLQATPLESRKYKKGTGELYANQRESDETVKEFGERLAIEIASNPDKYFSRRIIVRTEDDMADYMADMWAVGREIREAQLHNRWPRNPQQCMTFGKCPFFGVCTKTESLDDPTLFVKLDNPDQELPSAKPDKEIQEAA